MKTASTPDLLQSVVKPKPSSSALLVYESSLFGDNNLRNWGEVLGIGCVSLFCSEFQVILMG